eukprot:6957549-Prymnesium_polylepis.1
MMRPGAVSDATRALRCRLALWPMAYGAPCGGSGRYARPELRCRDWLARGTCDFPVPYGLWPMMRRVAVADATRAL